MSSPPAAAVETAARVNDFAFKIGTPNGTGSASANSLLRQAIFRMGIPVSGKNLFPSNIQGLPTWYEIRVSGRGHTARRDRFDLVVAMNPASYERDVKEVVAGGWVLHDDTWPLPRERRREDVTFLGVPLARLCTERFRGARERILLKNIAYVGAVSALLDIDVEVLEGLIRERFGRKEALLEANFVALRLGREAALERFECPLPIHLAPMDATAGSILIDGNTAAALGCVYAGATVAAWYPITPSTSLVDAFRGFCEDYRRRPENGERRYAILQAEDELAAAGMVVGAGWTGARAFTATSGPGISLMSEFIGLAYYAEVPCVFFDVQRTGPSTGMPTRTQQGDLLTCVYASHGDTKHVALFPCDPAECFEFAVAAFDLAERFQTPVFVVSDLDIGMNDWVCRPLAWDDGYRPHRGKVLGAAELEAGRAFHRYLDVDGDGIPYRTLPGVHPKGAYFTRGSGHDRYGRYTEDAGAYTDVVDRLLRKLATAAGRVPAPELHPAPESGERTATAAEFTEGTSTAPDAPSANGGRAPATPPRRPGLVSIGGCHRAVLEAQDLLAEEGIPLDYLRIRAFPFGAEVERFLAGHDPVLVVEQNRDAQLRTLLLAETDVPGERLRSILHYGGQPLSAEQVMEGVRARLRATGDGQPRVAAGPHGAPDGGPKP